MRTKRKFERDLPKNTVPITVSAFNVHEINPKTHCWLLSLNWVFHETRFNYRCAGTSFVTTAVVLSELTTAKTGQQKPTDIPAKTGQYVLF